MEKVFERLHHFKQIRYMCENSQKIMMEEKLIDEIRSLFEQLKKEEKGQDVCNYRYKLPPNSGAYYQIAKQLVFKAHELSALNEKYDSSGLNSVLNKEVERVKLYNLEYDKNNKVKCKSQNELENLMHDATYHIRLYFWDVLKDIEP